MGKERLAAFSDGVLAIVITIMVLDLRVPHGAGVAALRPLLSALLGYALSFAYIGIYRNSHHHLLSVTDKVNGTVLWANMRLLFCPSLVPFATGWVGGNPSAPVPTSAYGVLLLMASAAFASPRIADGLYVLVALLWLVADRRIERAVAGDWEPTPLVPRLPPRRGGAGVPRMSLLSPSLTLPASGGAQIRSDAAGIGTGGVGLYVWRAKSAAGKAGQI